MRRRLLLRRLLPLVLALLVAACRGAAADDVRSGSESPAPSPEPAAIHTLDTEVGTILVDADGMTLYGFTDDPDGESSCEGECAEKWPPVPGETPLAAGLDADVFTTIERPDGTTQLVAGTRPLYTYVKDKEPGDLVGQGRGGVWYVVAPDGSLIMTEVEGASEEPSEQANETTAEEALGEPVLTDSQGFTIYYFRKDDPGVSNCYDPCSVTWPPVPADEQIDTGNLNESLLSTIVREDGIEQLAYDGRPMYLFIDDLAPGQVKGQGVGNVWFAVATDGSEIGPQGGVRVGSTDAGEALIDPSGFTLYRFAEDTPGVSNCNDPCSQTWVPVPGDTPIDGSVRASQFDVITRSDGKEQLALNGLPLYRFADDVNPGDANGEGMGDVWFAVPADDIKPAGGGVVTVGHTDLGPTLVNGDGMTLYAFVNDAYVSEDEGGSACNESCAEAWPPVPGDVTVDDAVTGQTRTITRSNGGSQLAIEDRPLYTSIRDREPGDINGHGSGGAWFAVAPDGNLYQLEAD